VLTAWGACAVAFVFLVRALPGVARRAGGGHEPWRVLRFSLPQTLNAALFVTIAEADLLVLGHYATAYAVGVYAIVLALLVPAGMVGTAINQMFAPRVAAAHWAGDRATLGSQLKRVTYWSTAVQVPMYALLPASGVFVLGAFGPGYAAGATALAILAAAQAVNAATGPLGQVLTMGGRQDVNVLNNAAVGALNIVCCLLLVPPYGMVGAACSTAVALTAVNLAKVVEVHRLFRVDPFRRDAVRALAALAAATAATLLVRALVDLPPALPGALVLASVFASTYVAGLRAIGIGEDERALLRTVRRRVPVPGRS
jgi:O-antigen/teichoic acid export membrane protein